MVTLHFITGWYIHGGEVYLCWAGWWASSQSLPADSSRQSGRPCFLRQPGRGCSLTAAAGSKTQGVQSVLLQLQKLCMLTTTDTESGAHLQCVKCKVPWNGCNQSLREVTASVQEIVPALTLPTSPHPLHTLKTTMYHLYTLQMLHCWL